MNKRIENLGLVRGGLNELHTRFQPAGAQHPTVVRTFAMEADAFQFRKAWRPLLGKVRNAMVQGSGTVLHLTSAVPGEGVSTVAREIVCAAAGMPHCRPLLLDFNQNEGGQGAAIGGPLPGVVASFMSRGLIEAAAVSACGNTFHAAEFDAVSYDAFAHRPGPTASVGAAGVGAPSGGVPLLGTDVPGEGHEDEARTMADLYGALCGAYNLIVVDCPPVQDAPYFVPLSQDTPDVVLVVRAEKTRIPVVLRARDEIPALGGRLVGVVMNGRRSYIPKLIGRHL